MPRDSLKRARRFGWLHLAVGITMGLEELKSRERGLTFIKQPGCLPDRKCTRSLRFSTLPTAVFGKSVFRNSTSRGIL
jgi:hypothetical protein